MARFNYIALDARGQESVGVIEASTSTDAVGQLRQAGYFPTSVTEEGKGKAPKASKAVAKAPTAGRSLKAKKKGGGMVFFEKKTVKSKVLMIFTCQLKHAHRRRTRRLLRGLTVLAKQEKDPCPPKRTIHSLADAAKGRKTFSESMAQHPLIFNKLYINIPRRRTRRRA